MTKIIKLACLLLLGLLLIPQAQAAWVDSSPSVEITKSRKAFDRVNRVLFSYVTIKNTSNKDLAAPVRLVISNPSIPVLNQTGTTGSGDAYLDIAEGLVAGASTKVRVDFQLKRALLIFDTYLESFENKVVGRVADGYLVGATVCLNINLNRKCDNSEPSDETISGGHYSINLPKGIDKNDYPIVAEVPKGAIDEDDGKPIEHGYTLSAPAGKPFFISPISSVIHTKSLVEKITGQQAADKLKLELGLEQSFDMFGDYISSDEMGVSTKKKIHTIAKITAKIMAENHDPIIIAAELSGLNNEGFTKKTLDAINLHVLGQLSTINEIIADIPENKVIDTTIATIPTTIPISELIKTTEWSDSQRQEFENKLTGEGSTAPKGEYTGEVCNGDIITESQSLAGIKYCIDIEGNKEKVRFFNVSFENQNTFIFLKNLKKKVKYTLYKKNENGLFKEVARPNEKWIRGGRILEFGSRYGEDFKYRLSQGEYKVSA